jgi:abhydrolase domain-containing protein 14
VYLTGLFLVSGKLPIRDVVSIFLEHLLTYNPLQFGSPPVLVVPSMSGAFFFPLLSGAPHLISGFVPVAPVGFAMYASALRQASLPPALCIWGENDARISEHTRFVSALGCTTAVIPAAGHPAYLDQPTKFNGLLLNYLRTLHAGEP